MVDFVNQAAQRADVAVINTIFGFLVAWVLARHHSPGKTVVDALVDLPFALPTAVAGIARTFIGLPFVVGGRIGEVLMYGTPLTDEVRQKVEQYLIRKWMPDSGRGGSCTPIVNTWRAEQMKVSGRVLKLSEDDPISTRYDALMRRLCVCALFGTLVTATAFAAAPEEKDGLAVLRDLRIDGGKITFVEHSDSPTMAIPKSSALNNLLPRTIVKIVLNPAKGSNINVEVWLPNAEKWNGRLLGLGNGGAAGSISPGTLAWPLCAGYAAVTTDMGTAPNDASGIGNPEVWKDFGFRATHLMTVTAKQVIMSYYGKNPEFSYFNGGSTGGQQALQEAQRYPEDYDGIIANIPAHCRTPLHAYFLWNDQILRKCPFSASQQNNIILAGNEYMAPREVPQTADKLVSDPRCDKKDIEAVIKLAREKDQTLTDAHADALRKLFDGPRHTVTGERIFGGIPFGSAFNIAHGHLYPFKWVFGANKDLTTIDFGKDLDTYTAALGPYLNAENPDLSRFEQRGGKLIMISGSADSCVPYHASLDYYERVAEHCGSIEKAKSFLRLYIIPGMSHGPGPGINKLPNMLDLVIKWRENGAAPDRIQGQRVASGKTELDMPLYPYPSKTGWTAETGFKPVDGPRGGVERIAERFRPSAAE